MNEISKINLSEQTKFRLSEIIEIKNYFYQEINQRKSYNKKLNKYVTAFDCIDKVLIVLSATSGVVISPINYFIYKYYWSSRRNSKCEFYSNFFSNNRNS